MTASICRQTTSRCVPTYACVILPVSTSAVAPMFLATSGLGAYDDATHKSARQRYERPGPDPTEATVE
jgi:hypothetical protein